MNAIDRDAYSGWGVVVYLVYYFVYFDIFLVKKIKQLSQFYVQEWIKFIYLFDLYYDLKSYFIKRFKYNKFTLLNL